MINLIFLAFILYVPLPSIQHFIWPLSMCILADICNHTWIPECAQEKSYGTLRLFIDECDMFEYNCDNALHFELRNYSDCFVTHCPTNPPCPSNPPCPNHAEHKMGQKYVYIREGRRQAVPPQRSSVPSLPGHMLKGKRRYTPIPKIFRKSNRRPASRTIKQTTPMLHTKTTRDKKFTTRKTTLNMLLSIRKMGFKTMPTHVRKTTHRSSTKTAILQKGSVIMDGRTVLRVVKGISIYRHIVPHSNDSDFLEK